MWCLEYLHIVKMDSVLILHHYDHKNNYIVVESYRNEEELFNLQCWALTAEAFFSKLEWEWIFEEFGYKGDYEFIYFNNN